MKRYILSISLAIILVVAAFLFFGSYGRYHQLHARLTRSERELRQLSRHQREIEAKARILEKAKAFVNRARALGLVRERWDRYEVEMKEPVTFVEAGKILSQTGSAGSYYFIPVSLRMTRKLSDKKEARSGLKSEGANTASGDKNGDLFMDLKGTFLVRSR